MQRRAFLTAGLLALSATACGLSPSQVRENGALPGRGTTAANPSQPTVPPTPVKLYGLNELVSVQGWELAIQKVEHLGNRFAWSQFSTVLVANGTWFAVIVDMKNTSAAPAAVNLTDFSLQAGDTTFTAPDVNIINAFGQARRAQSLGEPVQPGVSVSYYTIYDVAPDATNMQFTFLQDTRPVFAVGNATR